MRSWSLIKGLAPEDRAARHTARRLMEDPDVTLAVARLGAPDLGVGRLISLLNVLGEVGAPQLAESVAAVVQRRIMAVWKPDGRLRVRTLKGKIQLVPPCMAAVGVRALARLGLLERPQLEAAADRIVGTMRHDGGWLHVARDDGRSSSCPMASGGVRVCAFRPAEPLK